VCVFCLFFIFFALHHSQTRDGFPPKMIFYNISPCLALFHNKYQTIVVSFWQWRTLTKRTICRRGFNPVVLIVYYFISFFIYFFPRITQITYFFMFTANSVAVCFPIPPCTRLRSFVIYQPGKILKRPVIIAYVNTGQNMFRSPINTRINFTIYLTYYIRCTDRALTYYANKVCFKLSELYIILIDDFVLVSIWK
jgi:hypothetical protein